MRFNTRGNCMSRIITVDEQFLQRKLTDEEVEELLKLRDMRDEDIDTSDIPPITAEPKQIVRGKFYRGPMICLTPDLHRYFADLSRQKGVPMHELVNKTLTEALAAVRPEVAK